MPARPNWIGGASPRRQQDYDRARGSRQARGYDAAWQRCRDSYLAQHPLCEQCEREGRTTVANDVDHVVPIRRGGARLDEANLQSLCRSCHVRKTAMERHVNAK